MKCVCGWMYVDLHVFRNLNLFVCTQVPMSMCILHLWTWSNMYNADHVLSLLIMLRAANLAWSLVCFSHLSVACSHLLSSLENGKHFSVDLTLLLLFQLLARLRIKEWRWREFSKRNWCPLMQERIRDGGGSETWTHTLAHKQSHTIFNHPSYICCIWCLYKLLKGLLL